MLRPPIAAVRTLRRRRPKRLPAQLQLVGTAARTAIRWRRTGPLLLRVPFIELEDQSRQRTHQRIGALAELICRNLVGLCAGRIKRAS